MDLSVQVTFSTGIFKGTRTKKQVFWQKVPNKITQISFKGQVKHTGYIAVRSSQLCATTAQNSGGTASQLILCTFFGVFFSIFSGKTQALLWEVYFNFVSLSKNSCFTEVRAVYPAMPRTFLGYIWKQRGAQHFGCAFYHLG